MSTPTRAAYGAGVVTAAELDGTALLTEMLGIDSPSGAEAELARFLQRRLASLGFDVHVDDVGNVHAAWGSGDVAVALVGHLDTAPGRVAVRRDGRLLHGRGAVDAKGPLAAALTAVSRLPRDGGRRWLVIGAVEEEASSRGARHLAATMPAPQGLVILEPSGWQGITIGYKGSVRVRWSRRQPASHGAGQEPSAGDRALAFVRRLQDHAAAWSGDAGIFQRWDVRVLHMASRSDGLEDRAQVEIGMRVPPACSSAEARQVVLALAGEGDVEVLYADEAVRTDRSSPLARRFVRAVRAAGGSPRFKLKTGTSDLNHLVPAWGCPALAYGPGDSHLDHTPDERIDLDEFERGVGVLESALAA
ncbi:MAG TPA: [LysW]-lysine hydrolase [Candidatus Dormibacteraeota bacterium]